MSSVNKDYAEKRNFIRMFVDATVTITEPETGLVSAGESKNLSGDGVMFITEKEFKINQTLNVDISSKQSKLAPLKALFVVKRVIKLDNGKFQTAGKIDEIQ